jgi:hypothetical protein
MRNYRQQQDYNHTSGAAKEINGQKKKIKYLVKILGRTCLK